MKTRELGDLISVQSGFAFKSDQYAESGHFLVRIGNVQDGYLSLDNPKYVGLDARTERFALNEGDFLTSLTGNIGRVARVEKQHLPAALNQRVARLTVKDRAALSADFLYYFLSSDVFKEELSEGGHGAAQQNVSPSAIGELTIPIPSLHEQRRIVGILDAAFAGIATATAHAQQNLQNARALFESHLQSVFTEGGEGWSADQLDALTEPDSPITYGVVKPGNEGEVRFVRGGDLVRGKVRLNELRTISRAVSSQYRRTLLRGGELLICLVGQPGQVAVAPEELAGANIARQVGLIRLKTSMNAEYVRYFLQSPPGAEALGARESGSVQHL